MKQVFLSLAMLAMFAAPAMAQSTVNGGGPSPYEPGQTQLNVTINVQQIAEISWADGVDLNLNIANFGSNQGQEVQKTLRYLGNVPADIYCQMDASQLPQWTSLTVTPVTAKYGTPEAVSPTWRKDVTVHSSSPTSWVKMASMSNNSVGNSLANAGNLVVEFHAMAQNGVAAVGQTTVNVKWTVATVGTTPSW